MTRDRRRSLCRRANTAILDRVRYVLLVGLLGCYSPQPVPGAPCSSDGSCPSGLVCGADDRCVLPGATDARRDDAQTDPDAATDALIDAAVDAPPGDATGPVPQLLQQAFSFEAPATTLTTAFTVAPTAGHVLVAVAGCPSNALASISGAATTWTRAAFATTNSNIEVFVGVANGDKSVTITLPTCTSQMSLSISEWDHLAAMPIDITSDGSGITSPASAGSITTTGAPRLILFSVANYTPNTFGTPSDGPWQSLMAINGAVEIRTWYRVVTATGMFAPTVSETHHDWDAALVSLTAQ